MQGLRLSSAQISAGANTLDANKLKPSQVDDLVSVFRDFLGSLAADYSVRSDLEALTDTPTSNRCAKFAAYLILLQDAEFGNGGFAATNANRTGFNYSIDQENYLMFRYFFGLLYDIPDELDNRWISGKGTSKPMDGLVTKVW